MVRPPAGNRALAQIREDPELDPEARIRAAEARARAATAHAAAAWARARAARVSGGDAQQAREEAIEAQIEGHAQHLALRHTRYEIRLRQRLSRDVRPNVDVNRHGHRHVVHHPVVRHIHHHHEHVRDVHDNFSDDFSDDDFDDELEDYGDFTDEVHVGPPGAVTIQETHHGGGHVNSIHRVNNIHVGHGAVLVENGRVFHLTRPGGITIDM